MLLAHFLCQFYFLATCVYQPGVVLISRTIEEWEKDNSERYQRELRELTKASSESNFNKPSRLLPLQDSTSQSQILSGHMMGVEKIYPGLPQGDILNLILEKKPKEICFFGTHFNVNLPYNDHRLLEQLKVGTKLSFLVLDPFQEQLIKIQSYAFGSSPVNVSNGCEGGISSLIGLMKQFKAESKSDNCHQKIMAKITTSLPRMRAYVVDPNDTNATSYFIPYMNNVPATESPVIACKNIQDGLFGKYYEGLIKEWNSQRSTYIQKYIRNHECLANAKGFINKYPYFIDDYPEPKD